MKILFLVPYPFNEAPSQRFRFEQYFSALDRIKCKFTINPFLSRKAWNVFYSGNRLLVGYYLIIGYFKRFIHVFKAINYDYIFIHRELTPMGPPVYEWFISRVLKKRIIYDFDDAIWLPDPNEEGSLLALLKWKGKIGKICKWSYKISTGNDFLANYAKKYNQNVIINPTTIDTEGRHNPKHYPSKQKVVSYPGNNGDSRVDNTSTELITIGWTGTHSTLQYLQPLVPVLRKLNDHYNFVFKVIANRKPEFDLDNLSYVAWNKESEIKDLMDFDIGVMPLTDDRWSKGKCGFKALQYMALEIPTVASPVGVNTQIIENGVNGFLCTTEDEWLDTLSQLLEDQKLRRQLGNKGRGKINNAYSVTSNTQNFLDLFRDLL